MITNKYFIKILFSLFSFFLIGNHFSIATYAKINNKAESDKFLNEYCIEIVNAIKDAYEIQKISIENKDLKIFGEQGRWIGALSSVYGNLCRK